MENRIPVLVYRSTFLIPNTYQPKKYRFQNLFTAFSNIFSNILLSIVRKDVAFFFNVKQQFT